MPGKGDFRGFRSVLMLGMSGVAYCKERIHVERLHMIAEMLLWVSMDRYLASNTSSYDSMVNGKGWEGFYESYGSE